MRINTIFKLTVILPGFIWGLVNIAYAKNVGTLGELYPIAEMDFLKVIQAQVAAKLNNFQARWNNDFNQTMDRPMSVAGLSLAAQSRTWYFDPAVTLPDHVINPLDTVSLQQILIFYNADDVNQVRWAQKMDNALKGNAIFILVGGSVLNQRQLFHKAVYFDQGGKLTRRFQLQHVPALITQEGKRLKIQEVLPL